MRPALERLLKRYPPLSYRNGISSEDHPAVAREKEQSFSVEELELDAPLANEVLVHVVATGVCHTDLIVRDQWYPVPLPSVLGHERAGIVKRVGEGVSKARPQEINS